MKEKEKEKKVEEEEEEEEEEVGGWRIVVKDRMSSYF